ncbi:UDP-N-acetylmuramate--L-alanine ligase [bacterium]|nr:UDP-N-acetylmuramate--L-alanine ligase [bacterium]
MYNRELHFHFTGIGGSGMSGIAEILVQNGYTVSGSDLVFSSACKRLEGLGVPISLGHSAENLPHSASLLVYSSAVNGENPELQEARRRDLPVVKRAEVLAELMRMKFGIGIAGAHGKTTTTSMVGWLLEQGDLDPTVIIGGQVRKRGSGGRSGQGDFLVAEADESDRSFLLLKPVIALVTNIDREHMNAYGSEEELREAFHQFLNSVPFYGLAALCIDDPYLREVADNFQRRCTTYGFSEDADVRGVVRNLREEGVTLDIFLRDEFFLTAEVPVIGRHLAQNAVGAVAIARELGISAEKIQHGLASYPGVERRLEKLGHCRGITVYNDYGHHPVEVEATLKALRESSSAQKIRVFFQPHRYSRTEECYEQFLDCFQDADEVWIADIHGAGESPIAGVSGEGLARDIRHPAAHYLPLSEEPLYSTLDKIPQGEIVLFLGAGSIGGWAVRAVEHLQERVRAA